MMKRTTQFLLVATTALILAGCAGQPVSLGNVTSLDQIDLAKGEQLTSSASGFQLLLFIPIAINSRQQNAYDDLLTQAGDRALTDIKVTESWSWAFVGTVYTTTLEATAYPKKR